MLTLTAEKLMNGLEQVRDTVGDEKQSMITDADIKDALYHYFFDVEQSVAYLLGEYRPHSFLK